MLWDNHTGNRWDLIFWSLSGIVKPHWLQIFISCQMRLSIPFQFSLGPLAGKSASEMSYRKLPPVFFACIYYTPTFPSPLTILQALSTRLPGIRPHFSDVNVPSNISQSTEHGVMNESLLAEACLTTFAALVFSKCTCSCQGLFAIIVDSCEVNVYSWQTWY